MGLTNFKSELPSINDIDIAKNYLTEEGLLMLNNLVSGYFDFQNFKQWNTNQWIWKII